MLEFPDYPSNWDQIKKEVKKRDNYTCRRCNTRHPPNSPYLKVHHKKPLSKGGKTVKSNLVTLCRKCHKVKHPHLMELDKSDGKRATKKKAVYGKGYKRKKFGYFTGGRKTNYRKKK